MLSMAEEWYQNGTFWAAAAAVIALIAIPCTVWATIRAAHPKRVFTYELEVSGGAVRAASNRLAVTFDGTVVANPHILTIRVGNGGSRDIPSTAFDGGRSARFDVGVPIVAVLTPDPLPAEVSLAGTALLIAPCLIRGREVRSFTLLTDGRCRALEADVPLVDVRVRRTGEYSPGGRTDEEQAEAWRDVIP
jgi:hypothetical protein